MCSEEMILRPCPFCGSKEPFAHYEDDDGIGEWACVICVECGCKGPAGYELEEAVTAWNKRNEIEEDLKLRVRHNEERIKELQQEIKELGDALDHVGDAEDWR